MILSSIFLNASDQSAEPVLPATVDENINSFKQCHPDLPHRLFLHEDILALIRERFSKEVLDAYQSLKPYAYKADIARYCILYEFGGAYADLSYYFAAPLPFHPDRPIVFSDLPVSAPWDVSVGVLCSPPRHKAFERAIEMVCANVKRAYYGATSLCPTGPSLFGKALASTCEAEDLMTGAAVVLDKAKLQQLMPGLSLSDSEKFHCLRLRSKLIAIKRKRMTSPGLSELGITNGNDYTILWRSRGVYA